MLRVCFARTSPSGAHDRKVAGRAAFAPQEVSTTRAAPRCSRAPPSPEQSRKETPAKPILARRDALFLTESMQNLPSEVRKVQECRPIAPSRGPRSETWPGSEHESEVHGGGREERSHTPESSAVSPSDRPETESCCGRGRTYPTPFVLRRSRDSGHGDAAPVEFGPQRDRLDRALLVGTTPPGQSVSASTTLVST